jgi:hypothetical protein
MINVHLVGSIGLDSSADVFAAVGDTIKPYIKRCPDGEIGGRRLWVSYQWPVLRSNSAIEVARDEVIGEAGLSRLRIKDGFDPAEIHFGELGYAREARVSYVDFLRAREAGSLASATRFQVSLPTPIAVVGAFIASDDVPRLLPAYTAAMLSEVDRICGSIPHRDLALQWDVCIEMLQWDGRVPFMPPPPNMEVLLSDAFERLTAPIPDDVELGFHLCYGDLDATHFVDPIDTRKAVELANLIIRVSRHRVDWVHMPVPIDRDDDTYFEPLAELERDAETELYLGLIHAEDGVEGARRRMEAARRHADAFGIATECGMARARSIETVKTLLAIHAQAAATA